MFYGHEESFGRTETIDGKSFLTFQPNTIVYAVDVNSDLGKKIKNAKIGVVWHTTYSGKTMDSMKAKFGADAKKLSKSRAVWSIDATFKDTSGNVKFTSNEAKQFQKVLNMASGSLKRSSNYLRIFSFIKPRIKDLLFTFIFFFFLLLHFNYFSIF